MPQTMTPATASRRTHPANEPMMRPVQGRVRQARNVGELERWLSVAGGAALGTWGLSRGSVGGLALALLGGGLMYRGLTGHCMAYQALGVSTAELRGPRASIEAGQGVKVEESLTINRPPEELYRFWRNFENLPRFMRHLELVKAAGPSRSHWVARGPLDTRFEWDAEVITDKVNETIAWRSLEGSEVDSAGSVHFRRGPAGRGTEMKVTLKYDPPAGAVGAAVARLFGQAPDQQIREDLRRFKQLMEAGEVPTTAGQPTGQCRA